MNPDHARFADWDAAYLLGALTADERRTFEEHLADCDRCRQALSEIAPLPGLLARVATDRAQSMLDEATAAGELAPGDDVARARFVAAGTRSLRQRARRRWAVASTAAAAVVIAVVIAVSVAVAPRGDVETVALEPVVDIPLTASVELADVAWGTRIDLTCSYGETPDGVEVPEGGWPYVLVVVADDGSESELSTWRAGPNTTAHLSAGTELPTGDIAAVEIRSITRGIVLMRADVAPGP